MSRQKNKLHRKAPAKLPGSTQLSTSAPTADHFQTAQSSPDPNDDTYPVDRSHWNAYTFPPPVSSQWMNWNGSG